MISVTQIYVYLAAIPAATPASSPVEIFGTKLIGVTRDNGRTLLVTVVFVVALLLVNWLLRSVARLFLRIHRSEAAVIWVRQGISLFLALVMLSGIISVWFDNPVRLATFMGLVTAGVAFALQKPISALAGYLVILRGKTLGVGDRITMSGVRGDVVALEFAQTSIMEMGQPPDVQNDQPAMWVHTRQYTGRIVSVSNSKVFDEPIYNYTREFPYLWEEMRLPISYKDDRYRAEQILLETANRHTIQMHDLSEDALKELGRRYFIAPAQLTPTSLLAPHRQLAGNVRAVYQRHARSARTEGRHEPRLAQALDQTKIGIASEPTRW